MWNEKYLNTYVFVSKQLRLEMEKKKMFIMMTIFKSHTHRIHSNISLFFFLNNLMIFSAFMSETFFVTVNKVINRDLCSFFLRCLSHVENVLRFKAKPAFNK